MTAPREFVFPIGGNRVVSATSPFSGESPFSDRFQRFAAALADAVSCLAFSSTTSGTPPDGTGLNPTEKLTCYPTQEMRACAPPGWRPNPLLLVGVSMTDNYTVGLLNTGPWDDGTSPLDTTVKLVLARDSIANDYRAVYTDSALSTDVQPADHQLLATVTRGAADLTLTGFVSVLVHSIRADSHQILGY